MQRVGGGFFHSSLASDIPPGRLGTKGKIFVLRGCVSHGVGGWNLHRFVSSGTTRFGVTPTAYFSKARDYPLKSLPLLRLRYSAALGFGVKPSNSDFKEETRRWQLC